MAVLLVGNDPAVVSTAQLSLLALSTQAMPTSQLPRLLPPEGSDDNVLTALGDDDGNSFLRLLILRNFLPVNSPK